MRSWPSFTASHFQGFLHPCKMPLECWLGLQMVPFFLFFLLSFFLSLSAFLTSFHSFLPFLLSFFPFLCVHAKSLQSCPTLCNPMDRSPPDSSVHGIVQARRLEWVVVPILQGAFPLVSFLKKPAFVYGVWMFINQSHRYGKGEAPSNWGVLVETLFYL